MHGVSAVAWNTANAAILVEGTAMLARAFAAKVLFAWGTADEAYGQVKYLRSQPEAHAAAHCRPPRSTTPR